MCASTLIAIHYSVWVVCLQVVCTASGFTFRPVLSCSRLNFCVTWSEKIKKKKKEQKTGTKAKMNKRAPGGEWSNPYPYTDGPFSIQGPQQGFASLSARLVRLDSIIAL